MRATASAAAFAVFVAAAWNTTGQAEETWYWNIHDHEGYSNLYLGGEAVPEEITDGFGPLPFFCLRKSGKIFVRGIMSDPLRAKMADAVKSDDVPPYVTFMPSAGREDSITLDMEYSAMDGWIFRFEILASHPYFEHFRKAGKFDFAVGGVPVDMANGRHRRIENIGKFIDMCKQPTQGSRKQ